MHEINQQNTSSGDCKEAMSPAQAFDLRGVDLLVQVELTGEYEHSPTVTADNTFTLLKKQIEIG